MPPEAFLRWLIENPAQLTWPLARTRPAPVEAAFGAPTQAWREQLFHRRGPDAAAQAREEALRELGQQGAAAGPGQWWCFEGERCVDCCLETDTLLLSIEGKRTEPLSKSTNWYPERNQLWRNLEVVCIEAAARGKRPALMLLAERPDAIPPCESAWPHLAPEEQDRLRRHYVGCLTWREASAAIGMNHDDLPDTANDLEL